MGIAIIFYVYVHHQTVDAICQHLQLQMNKSIPFQYLFMRMRWIFFALSIPLLFPMNVKIAIIELKEGKKKFVSILECRLYVDSYISCIQIRKIIIWFNSIVALNRVWNSKWIWISRSKKAQIERFNVESQQLNKKKWKESKNETLTWLNVDITFVVDYIVHSCIHARPWFEIFWKPKDQSRQNKWDLHTELRLRTACRYRCEHRSAVIYAPFASRNLVCIQ